MITREADYSIRAILFLSSKWPDGYPIAASVLAEKMDIPYRFLRRIVRKLADAGFVSSQRGRTGGIRLAKPPARISLFELLNAVDGRAIRFNTCLNPDSKVCTRESHCPVHRELQVLQHFLDERLSDIRFDQLA